MTIISRIVMAGLTAGFILSSVSAIAADSNGFTASTAADSKIRIAAMEFKRGDFAKSATFSKSALKGGMNRRKQAVAQSNLCAAYGAMGELERAGKACDAAIALRPGYAPATANKAALTVRLAQINAAAQVGAQ